MDEVEWWNSTRLFELMGFLGERLSDRKRRLFAVACCRRFAHLLTDERSRRALDVADRYADGTAGEDERLRAEHDAFEAHVLVRDSRFDPCPAVPWSRQAELLTQAATLTLARGIYYAEDAADHARWSLPAAGKGWPAEQQEEALQCRLLRDVVGPPLRHPTVEPAWRLYNDGAALGLARWIHERGDFECLPVLADALEEAGCADETILEHCHAAREHVRGCWVVDVVLGVG